MQPHEHRRRRPTLERLESRQLLTTWDLVSGFSPSANPNGPWSYGKLPAGQATGFDILWAGFSSESPPLAIWSWGRDTGPYVIKNTGGAQITYNTIDHPPNMLNLDPSFDGSDVIVRFTVPRSAYYSARGAFQGLDATTTDVRIFDTTPGAPYGLFPAYNGYIRGRGEVGSFDFYFWGIEGHTIDFIVNQGPGGSLYDSTGLALTISDDARQPFAYQTPAHQGIWPMRLFRSGSDLVLLNDGNGAVLKQMPLDRVSDVRIVGTNGYNVLDPTGENNDSSQAFNESLTVDFARGGPFQVAGPIVFHAGRDRARPPGPYQPKPGELGEPTVAMDYLSVVSSEPGAFATYSSLAVTGTQEIARDRVETFGNVLQFMVPDPDLIRRDQVYMEGYERVVASSVAPITGEFEFVLGGSRDAGLGPLPAGRYGVSNGALSVRNVGELVVDMGANDALSNHLNVFQEGAVSSPAGPPHGVGSLRVQGGPREDVFLLVNSDPTAKVFASPYLFLEGNGGRDSLRYLGYTGSAEAAFFVTGRNTGRLAAQVNTNLNPDGHGAKAVVQFEDVEDLLGGEGSDTFVFEQGGSLDGSIAGLAGATPIWSPFSVGGFSFERLKELAGQRDRVEYRGASGVRIDLVEGRASFLGDRLTGIEDASGGSGNDYVRGDDRANNLRGGGGNDVIDGRGGDDVIFCGLGNDLATGGAGNDVIVGDEGNDTLGGGAGHDVLVGLGGDDLLNGDDGRDILVGGLGQDALNGAAEDDLLIGGDYRPVSRVFGPVELINLTAEWSSKNPVERRIEFLTGRRKGGANGTLILNNRNVIDDKVRDVFSGSTGTDYYFLGVSDQVTDQRNVGGQVRQSLAFLQDTLSKVWPKAVPVPPTVAASASAAQTLITSLFARLNLKKALLPILRIK